MGSEWRQPTGFTYAATDNRRTMNDEPDSRASDAKGLEGFRDADDLEDLIEDAVAVGDALPGETPLLIDDEFGAADVGAKQPIGVGRLAIGVAGAALAVLSWACPALIGKGVQLSALNVVLFRGWIGIVVAFTVLHARGGRLTVRGLQLSLLGGLALGVDLMLFFAAIKATTVANATMIGSMTPLLLMFLAPKLFGERLRWPDVLAGLVAMAGCGLVVLASSGVDGWSLRGDVYAALCLVAWTAYLIASKRVRGEVSSLEFAAAVTLVATALITPIAMLDPTLRWPTPAQLGLLTIMAISGWLGHVMMNWSLRFIPIWVGGTSAVAVPVVATALAAAFLGEAFVWTQGVGMAIVITALTVVGMRSPKLMG